MAIQELIQELLQVDDGFQQELIIFLSRIGIFTALGVTSWIISQLIPSVLRAIVKQLMPARLLAGYDQVVTPLRRSLVATVSLGLVALHLEILRQYESLFGFLNFFVFLALSLNAGWLFSRLARQSIRIYGVEIFRQLHRDVDDFILVIETLVNTVVIFFAVVFFAQSQNLNLISVLAGLGVVGLALSLAAKETIAQVIGSIVLYLDRPYLPGEYVRVNFNPLDEDLYGRIESIGIRSTKIRVAVKNTLVVAPNSLMVSKDIENISRGNKVMALLYIDFPDSLNGQQRAIAKEIIEESISSIFGIEPLSTKVVLFDPEDGPATRARVSFFLLSSGHSSLSLRKRLIDIANRKISKRFAEHHLQFDIQESILYIDSPITR